MQTEMVYTRKGQRADVIDVVQCHVYWYYIGVYTEFKN